MTPKNHARFLQTKTLIAPLHARPNRLAWSITMLAAGGLLALGAGKPAQAQTTTTTSETQTIVVTATKRTEKQREVAGNVSVVQGADLERRGAVDQEDAFRLIPGIQLAKGEPSYNNVVIRGLATSGCPVCQGLLQNPTGMYLEDVPLTDPQGKLTVPDIFTFDLERVEVLRGPQGALFGSASLSGAVRYLYAKPDLKSFGASVLVGLNSVSKGDTGHVVAGMVNAPLSQGVAGLRVVVFDRKDGGFIDNPKAGVTDANFVKQRGGRVLLGVQPTKALSANLILSSEETKQGEGFSVVEGKSIRPDLDALRHNAPTLSPRSNRFDFANLAVNYDLGAATVTSNTGWWKKSRNEHWDLTPLYSTLGFAQALDIGTVYSDRKLGGNAMSQELRIASNAGSALSYVAGVFYQKAKNDPNGSTIFASTSAAASFLNSRQTGDSDSTEQAAFFDAEYSFGAFSVGAGARFYKIESRIDGTFNGAPNAQLKSDESGNTPKISLKYKFGSGMWYALASKGYRFGGQNGAPTFLPYESDSLWNYETGVRLNPVRDLQLDLTIYRLDWSKAQITFVDTNTTPPNTRTGNVGKAQVDGLELAMQYRVSPAFDAGLALAFTDAKTSAAVRTGSGNVAAGSRLPGTPKLQYSLLGTWKFAGPFGSAGRLQGAYTSVGDRTADIIAGAETLPKYDSVDASLAFTQGPWTLSLTASNLGDKRGITGSIYGAPAPNLPHYEYFLQKPRTLGVSLRYDL
jgi:iron complex outermembrane receptor protein